MKIIERIQEFKEKEDSRSISQNKLGNVCFQQDIAYGDFKDLTRRTASDKIFSDKAFNINQNAKNDGYRRGLASMIYKLFDKKNFYLQIKQIYN